MPSNFRYLTLILCVLLMVACHRKPPEFAPLVPLTSTENVQTVWNTSIGNAYKKKYLKLTPSVYEGTIYAVTASGQLSAINAQSGQRIWQKSMKESISSGVAADHTQLYLGTHNAEVIALNRQNGAILWRTPVSNEVLSTPNATSEMVLVKTIDDHLYAINKQNGEILWTYKQPASKMALRGGNSPLVANGLVIVGFTDGSVGVFDQKTGGMSWSRMIGQPKGTNMMDQMVDIDDSMAVANGVIYVASYQGTIAAFNLQNGQLLWERNISSYAGLTLDAQRIYVTDDNGDVLALNRKTGNLIWKQDKLTNRGVTGPAVSGNTVVVADKEGFVHWLSASNGNFVARIRADKAGIIANPVSQGQFVYIYTSSGKLIKYRS